MLCEGVKGTNICKVKFVGMKQIEEATKGWLKYSKSFPDVVECIKDYPGLYRDVGTEKPNDMVSLCIWRTIGLRFPKMTDIQEIWTALRSCFLQYMQNLEIGVDCKWSTNWWRSLARMKFLVEAKYSTSEPLYYIITNKMVEQIDKFATMEMASRANKIVENTNNSGDETTSGDVEIEINDSVLVQLKEKTKEVELCSLLTAIQKYPIICTKAASLEKSEAWQKVAKELRMSVPDCLFAFKTAIKKYLTYKKQDPVSRLHIHEKYYKKFDEFVHNLPSSRFSSACRAKINIKTPHEINLSVDTDHTGGEFVFPERFISDINMSNSSSDLAVKNWIYALGNITNNNECVHVKLKGVLKKHLPNVKK